MKYEILDLLKKSNDYISGEDIGLRFNVSRAAVWKYIAKLREEGYNISSVSNKGYKLEKSGDVLNRVEIGYKNCVCLERVDSTNEEAKRQAAAGADEGLLVTAEYQYAGKGRLGRSWEDKGGQDIAMSILLKPSISPMEASQLTLVAGLAAAETVKRAAAIDVKIKWPNDIVFEGKKLVGILTEMSASMERVNYAVVGIGINVNSLSFSDEIKDRAVSLSMLTGRSFNRAEIISLFMSIFMPMYKVFCTSGLRDFVEKYNSACVNVGKRVRAVSRTGTAEGIALGIDGSGCLLIKNDSGQVISVMSGEVSVRNSDNSYA